MSAVVTWFINWKNLRSPSLKKRESQNLAKLRSLIWSGIWFKSWKWRIIRVKSVNFKNNQVPWSKSRSLSLHSSYFKSVASQIIFKSTTQNPSQTIHYLCSKPFAIQSTSQNPSNIKSCVCLSGIILQTPASNPHQTSRSSSSNNWSNSLKTLSKSNFTWNMSQSTLVKKARKCYC